MGNKFCRAKKDIDEEWKLKEPAWTEPVWTEIKLNEKQELALLKQYPNIGSKYIIIHQYNCGALLVSLKEKSNLEDNLLYLIDIEGNMKQTLHPDITYENSDCFSYWWNFQIFTDTFTKPIEVHHRPSPPYARFYVPDFGYMIVRDYSTYTTGLPIRIPSNLEGVDQEKYFLAYGGVFQFRKNYVPFFVDENRVNIRHYRCDFLDKFVRKESLPISPEFIKEAKVVVSKYLLVNVIGIIIDYL